MSILLSLLSGQKIHLRWGEASIQRQCLNISLTPFAAHHQGHHPEGGEDGELEEQGLADEWTDRMAVSAPQREDGGLRHVHQPHPGGGSGEKTKREDQDQQRDLRR